MATSPQLREGVLRILADGTRNVVIDMSGVSFLDSSAIGALVVVLKAVREGGGRLCLAAVPPQVQSVLTVTSVDRAIDLYDTVQAAEADMPPVAA